MGPNTGDPLAALAASNPYAAGAQAIGAALSGGTSSAGNETGSVGTGVQFNIGTPNHQATRAAPDIPPALLLAGAGVAVLLVVLVAIK